MTVVDLQRETPFAARLPLLDDSFAYWTVFDADFRRIPIVDDYLFSLARSGRAENTVKAYARDIAIFLRWCQSRRRAWLDPTALDDFQAFLLIDPARHGRAPRRETTANRLLTAVRGLLRFCVEAGHLPKAAIGRLYSIKDYRFLPVEARGDRPITDERLSPRHHLPAPLQSEPPGVISEVQFVAMLRAARSSRDRFLLQGHDFRSGHCSPAFDSVPWATDSPARFHSGKPSTSRLARYPRRHSSRTASSA